jgi:hypothetical protein
MLAMKPVILTAHLREFPQSLQAGRQQDSAFSLHGPSNSCLLCHSGDTDDTVKYIRNQHLLRSRSQTKNKHMLTNNTVTKSDPSEEAKLWPLQRRWVPCNTVQVFREKIYSRTSQNTCHFPVVDIY